MPFDFGPDPQPEPQADPEVERLKAEEAKRLREAEEAAIEKKKAIASGFRGRRSLLSSGNKGFRKLLGANV
jgi:hypothetical protein